MAEPVTVCETTPIQPAASNVSRIVIITAATIALVVAAAFLRIPDLALRPFHGDEAVNAVKFNQLWTGHGYAYDPHEFHGPSLPYLTWPFVAASGAEDFQATSEATFRSVTVAFGILLVALTVLLGQAIGWPAALIAAGFVAVSPAFVFYSRYYIHEVPLVVFTLGAILAGWRYSVTKCPGMAVACGACFALMHATKETGALAGFAMVVALAIVWPWSRKTQSPGTPVESSQGPGTPADVQSPGTPVPGVFSELLRALRPRDLLLGVAAFVIVDVILFTSFFTNIRGVADSVLTYLTWLELGAAGNEGRHLHPWYYYFSLILWNNPAGSILFTELLILVLGLTGIIASLTGLGVAPQRRPVARFLAIYTLVLTAIYCAIPYKTPWSMLGFYHGWIILAGIGTWAVVGIDRRGAEAQRKPQSVGQVIDLPSDATGRASSDKAGESPALHAWASLRLLLLLPILAGMVHLGHQAWRINTVFYVHRFNPYTYSQPGLDVRRIGERARQIAAVAPDGADMPLYVIFHDNYWPLPYYLRHLNRVGYFTHVPRRVDVPMLIAHPNFGDHLDEMLTREYQHEYYGLRRSVPLEIFIRQDLWDAFMTDQQR